MASKDTTVTTLDDVQEVVTEKATVHIPVSDHGDNMTGERQTVTIHQGTGPLGNQAVFLGINGHQMMIPRGVPVELPVEAIEILDNAMETLYEPVGKTHVPREVKRFNYTVHYARAAAKAKK